MIWLNFLLMQHLIGADTGVPQASCQLAGSQQSITQITSPAMRMILCLDKSQRSSFGRFRLLLRPTIGAQPHTVRAADAQGRRSGRPGQSRLRLGRTGGERGSAQLAM